MKYISFIVANMKKRLFMLSFVSLSLGMSLTSCQDWLEMPSYTAEDTDYVFQNESVAEMFVLGCYRNLIHQEMYYHIGMGETVMHSCEDGLSSKYYICNYHYDATSPYTVTTVFGEQYRIIEATNIAISRLGKMPETENRNKLISEAKTIRAFCYLNLIRIYGDVPAVWTPLDEMDPDDEYTLYPKRAPRDEIYDRIIADLQEATKSLPWFKESGYATDERLTKQAAYGLLARVALYAGGYSLRWNLETNDPSTLKMARRSDETRVRELYQIASDACEAVIGQGENSLVLAKNDMTGFQYLWYNHCQRNFSATSSEMIWELAQYGANTNSQFNTFAQPGSRGGVYGSIKAMQFVLPTYYLSFDEKDTRRDVSCASYSVYFPQGSTTGKDDWVDVGTTYSSIFAGKFRLSWCVKPQENTKRNLDIPVLRYADVLLMYAEAQNYLNGGPTPAARKALQQVRDRAEVGHLPMAADQQGFEDNLVQERKWEFATEYMLRTDLIRMNRLAKELATTKQAMKDLSDRKGEYADVPVYRLYKYHVDGQQYGDKFLAVDYIDLTDQSEIAAVKEMPTDSKAYPAFQAKLLEIVKAHGVAVNEGDKWYPTQMFEAYSSTYNMNAHMLVGFSKKNSTELQAGKLIYKNPTGSEENGGKYPNWIEAADGNDGLYFDFKENCSELLPFAAQSVGHPLVDNPNLTQHPGYLK